MATVGGFGPGGGGQRDLGTVTGGMTLMPMDSLTKPYTRADFMAFLMEHDKRCTLEEQSLLNKIAGTLAGTVVATSTLGWALSGRLPWERMEKTTQLMWLRRFGRPVIMFSVMSFPIIFLQQWAAQQLLALPETSELGVNARRLMLTQRYAMLFQRTATREVSRVEQAQLSADAAEVAISNRMAGRPSSNGAMDVNMALGGQVLTPVAQSGYKPMPPKNTGA